MEITTGRLIPANDEGEGLHLPGHYLENETTTGAALRVVTFTADSIDPVGIVLEATHGQRVTMLTLTWEEARTMADRLEQLLRGRG